MNEIIEEKLHIGAKIMMVFYCMLFITIFIITLLY